MKTYAKAPDECSDRATQIIKKHYPEIKKAGVRIDILSVSHDSEGPALTHQGYAAAAVVRATNVKERTKGAGDVEIVIDEHIFHTLDDKEKDALLHHEIHHIVLKIDTKTGQVKLDCRGRPKIGMKKHDYQFGWFTETAKLYGRASFEVKQATKLFISEKQTLFEFAMGEATRLALEEATAK